MRAFLERFNLNEGVFDIAFLVYMLLGGWLFSNASLIDSPLLALFASVLPAFMLPWYMGDIVARYMRGGPSKLKTAAIALLGLSLVVGLVYNVIGLVQLGAAFWVAPGALLAFIFGCVLGIVLSVVRGEAAGDEGEMLQIIALGIAFAFLIPAPIMIYLSHLGLETRGIVAVLVLAGTAFVFILLLILYLVTVHEEFKGTETYRYVRNRAVDLVFPLMIATAFIFWQAMEQGVVAEASESPGKVIWYLTITGLLPFRLLLLVTPPIRWPNILMGLGMLSLAFMQPGL